MGKIMQLLLVLPLLFDGCHRGGQEEADWDYEITEYPGACFDSLMWLQYHCPDDEEKTTYEWNWAYEVREALGVDDLDSLATLCHGLDVSYESYANSGTTCYMTTAAEVYAGTARFRMLNIYQTLAELTADTPLGATDFYYHDYMLWEKLFEEFDENYKDGGNGWGIELCCYYRRLAELRIEILLEEFAFFSEDKTKSEPYVHIAPSPWEKQWLISHPAIHRWYDYRMLMADRIQCDDPSWAQSLRASTFKQVSRYRQFEIKIEDSYRIDDEEE